MMLMTKEIWKKVEGYEDRYEVSNLGRVRSLDRYINSGLKNQEKVFRKGKMLQPTLHKGENRKNLHPFVYFGFVRNGKNRTERKFIHKLVADAFLPNPNNLTDIIHLNKDLCDNRVCNLKRVTTEESASFYLEDFENEEWKPVVGWEGYYEVSNMGRVRSLNRIVDSEVNRGQIKTKTARILLQSKNSQGYPIVHLNTPNRSSTLRVHRLVALAFLPNPNNLPEVNHIDGNKENAKLTNLEWVTSKQNVVHAKYSIKNNSVLRIAQFGGEDYKTLINVFPSYSKASILINSTLNNISDGIKKNRIRCGYKWVKLTEEEYEQYSKEIKKKQISKKWKKRRR